ncbi:MAG: glycosyltransferase, partial [Cruoricaptor ignavus]|nr:glycosyltransferase [Cruoricaptor ignavus]
YKNTRFSFFNFFRRMKAYKKGFLLLQKPDLTHGNILKNNMFFALYLKLKYGIPFVISEHWSGFRRENHNFGFLEKYKIKFISHFASRIFPVSSDLKNGLNALGISKPMQVIPNTVDLSLFYPSEKTNDRFTFLHISNLIPIKNADKILKVALELWEEGWDFDLKIGGDGDLKPLENLAKQSSFSEKIFLFGEQTHIQVSELMRSSDAFILFSSTENQPCVLAEAFATGISVIATDVGGVREFFPKNGGILLSEVNETELKSAMKTILLQNFNFDKNGAVSFAKTHFSKEKIGEKFSEVYQEILGNNCK